MHANERIWTPSGRVPGTPWIRQCYLYMLLDISIINVINIYDSIVLIVLPYKLDNMQANSIESVNCYHIGIIRSQ